MGSRKGNLTEDGLSTRNHQGRQAQVGAAPEAPLGRRQVGLVMKEDAETMTHMTRHTSEPDVGLAPMPQMSVL